MSSSPLLTARVPSATKDLTVVLVAGVATPYTLAVDLALGLAGTVRADTLQPALRLVARLAGQLAARLDLVVVETVATLRAARVVLLGAADALEAGILDDLARGLEDLSTAVALIERVSDQIDRALPVLDATAPTLGLMNGTLAQLNTTLGQIEAIPGVRMARRLVSRPATPAPAG